MTVEEWIAAGLYDPALPDAEGRLELLTWIAAHDVPVDAMVAAASEGHLNALVGDRRLRGEVSLTIEDVAAHSGLDIEAVRQLRRATGFPETPDDQRVYSTDELSMFELFAAADAFFSRDELLHFVRVMSSSLRRIAEAASEMFLRDVEAPLQLGPRDELALAQANLAGVDLVDNVTKVFGPLFRGELQATTTMTRRARIDACDYMTMPLSIGFVDLSGFTAHSGRLEPAGLLELVVAFESAAFDLVSAKPGGRLIKVIGDEVMFSAVTPDEACDITTGLVARARTWGVEARGGLAHGSVVTSGGDVYGTTVNLASRIADVAVPGEVLVDEAVARGAPDHRFEPAGKRLLKGFAEPVRLWSLGASD